MIDSLSCSVLPNSQSLHTLILRPAGIYGDGESRHLPRILNVVQQGLGKMCIGSNGMDIWMWMDDRSIHWMGMGRILIVFRLYSFMFCS